VVDIVVVAAASVVVVEVVVVNVVLDVVAVVDELQDAKTSENTIRLVSTTQIIPLFI
jgi:hypothetical protein